MILLYWLFYICLPKPAGEGRIGGNGMNVTVDRIISGVLEGDRRSISKAITISENRHPDIVPLINQLFPYTGRAHVIGITGNPGAGKSTMVNQLIRQYQSLGKKIAVLAVDPSSPFTGGAILGDRVRIDEELFNEQLYVRSVSARGALGGLSKASFDSIMILDAAGFDVILAETVGTGQSEVEIINMAHTTILLLVPGLGDDVQAIKSGILEIADLLVVNKADMPGASSTVKDLQFMLMNRKMHKSAWSPKIYMTEAHNGKGVDELMGGIAEHRQWLVDNQLFSQAINVQRQLRTLLMERLEKEIRDKVSEPMWQTMQERLKNKEISPYEMVEQVLSFIKHG